MTDQHYWPGSLTWTEIVERIRSWSDGPITRDEAYEVMQVASILGIFMRREEKQVSEQMQLVARILDGLLRTIPALMPHPDETGLLNVGKCRYCDAIGQVHGTHEIRHEHTDECLLALNDQLQKSIKGVVTSQHTEEQEG